MRFTVRLLAGFALSSFLSGYGSCDEDGLVGGVRRQVTAQSLETQLKLRDDYIKALEERITRMEKRVLGSRKSNLLVSVDGQEQPCALGHDRRDGKEEVVPEEEADIWRRARDQVQSRTTAAQSTAPAVKLSTLALASTNRRSGTNEDRLSALEATLGSVNVTSLANEIQRLRDAALETSPFNPGDTAWLIVSSTLVLLMTIPGLALFYGGLVRVQNVLSTVMQSFSIACLITVEWIVVGYSLSFTPGGLIYGDFSAVWLRGVYMNSFHTLMPTVPEPIFCLYELTFAIITPALICGSFADRLKFGPMLVFMGLWHLTVYCPLSHAMWMPKGFLFKAHVLDFAGGNVVHVAAGFSGLVCSIVVGKRTNFGSGNFHPHNILISVLGAALLWVGWLGFNGGSSGGANSRAAIACLNTQISAATGSLSWMCTEWLIRKRPSVLGIISGALAGLVCITPGAGFVNITGAFVSGLLAGPTCFAACQLKKTFNFDDALDAFGIHGPGGILGGIVTGLFAQEEIGGTPGVFEGNTMQLPLQLYGTVISVIWSVVVTWILLKLIDMTLGLRVGIDEELLGLDMACHGESVMPDRLGISISGRSGNISGHDGHGTARSISASGHSQTAEDWHHSNPQNNSTSTKRQTDDDWHAPAAGAHTHLPAAFSPHPPAAEAQPSLTYGIA